MAALDGSASDGAPQPPYSPATITPNAAAAAGIDLEAGGQPVNVRLDLSVLEQTTAASAQPKTLMVILADRAVSRMRSGFEDRDISVDGRAVVVDGRIRVSLTVIGDRKGETPSPFGNRWNYVFSLLLESGKPMIALEMVDGVSNRRLSIEVKATILK